MFNIPIAPPFVGGIKTNRGPGEADIRKTGDGGNGSYRDFLFQIDDLQGSGMAGGDTRRLKPFEQAVFTHLTLAGLLQGAVELRSAVRAGRDAVHAPVAEIRIDLHDTVTPLGICPVGTNPEALRVFAMVARQRQIFSRP